MKVVFLKDVPKVGRKHEVKEVAEGYAFNFLFPKKLAEVATPKLLAEIEALGLKRAAQKILNEAFFKKHLETLKERAISIKGKANAQGHLFAGVHKEEILVALKAQTGIELPPEMLLLEKPIREIGEFKLAVEGYGQKGTLMLMVTEA